MINITKMSNEYFTFHIWNKTTTVSKVTPVVSRIFVLMTLIDFVT